MPKLTYKLDTIDNLDEALKALYTKKADGKFYLDADVDVEELTKQVRTSNLEAMNRRKELEAWSKLGLSAEEIEQLKKDKEDREAKDAEKKGEWEKLKEQIVTQHNAEKEKWSKREKDLFGQLRSVLVDNAALQAISSEKGSPDLLLPIIHKHADMIEENGTLQVRILDDKGAPRVNAKGEFLTIADLVSEFKSSEKFGRAFEATGKGGSGADPASGRSGGNSGGGVPLTRSAMSVAQKAEYAEKHGMDAYRALPFK